VAACCALGNTGIAPNHQDGRVSVHQTPDFSYGFSLSNNHGIFLRGRPDYSSVRNASRQAFDGRAKPHRSFFTRTPDVSEGRSLAELPEGFQFRTEIPQDCVERFRVRWRDVRECNPLGFDAEFFEPSAGIIRALSAPHRTFQELAGLFLTGENQHSASPRGQRLQEVMSFDFSRARDCNE